jgi:stage II sporulation protein AA (anti-sigma F factor antagonist)
MLIIEYYSITNDKEDKLVNVKHFVEDKLLVFEITEDLDHHVTEKIRRRADYEIQRFMPKRVILDFNRVVFMDSAGIGLVIGRYKTTCCYGGKLEMINVSSTIKKIFEMSGILKIIPIISSTKEVTNE